MIENRLPVDVYREMRKVCGLSPKSEQAAKIGLKNSLYTVMIENHERVLAMGRVIGDGGTACQLVDICVHPGYQKQGLGKEIMSHLMKYIERELPETCYISLIADGDARYLYEKFGFKDTLPESTGMFFEVK
jgi:ribosomal protein S18 acetylase RimI-like enzyme